MEEGEDSLFYIRLFFPVPLLECESLWFVFKLFSLSNADHISAVYRIGGGATSFQYSHLFPCSIIRVRISLIRIQIVVFFK